MKNLNTSLSLTEPTSCAIRGRQIGGGIWEESEHGQRLELGTDVSNSVTTVAKDSYVITPCILRLERTEEEKARRHLYGDKGAKYRKGKQYTPMTDGCSRTITTFELDNPPMETTERKYRIRKLTPRECFRLMDVDDKYIDKIQESGISECQQYKLAGNSIVVNCMFLMFENLFVNVGREEGTLF